MRPGKVPNEVLERFVFPHIGRRDPSMLLGPGLGRDAALVRLNRDLLVMSTDPITGSVEDAGWLAVHVNANDIATFGVRPTWFLVSVILPVNSSEQDVDRIMKQIGSASAELGITVVGGHTEVTEGLTRPIIAGFMMGVTRNGQYVTSSGAREGDRIIVTKTAGIEGTSILASECYAFLANHLSKDELEEAKFLRNSISVVRDGVTAFGTGHVSAMHDPTECGLSGGLHEICDASGLGFTIDLDTVPFHPVTRRMCEILRIDPMELISSGCMLITGDSNHADSILSSLRDSGVKATVIGETVGDPKCRIAVRKGKETTLRRPDTDALWEALKRAAVP